MKSKRIFLMVNLIIIQILMLLMPNVFATNSSLSFSASNENPTVGDSVTVSVTAVAGAFNLTLTGNGETKQILGQTDTTDNVSKSTSITFTPTEAKSYTFTLTGDYSDFYKDNATDVSKTIIITAKAKSTPGTPKNNQTTSPTTNNTPKTKEPKFSSANETVYATTDVRVRSSYSTTSSVLGSLRKNQSVTRIGVGDNGWSKISYNGLTAYVSSKYLTTTKPEGAAKPKETNTTANGAVTTTETEKSSNANLKSLEIEGQTLSPTFNTSTSSYSLGVENDVTKLNITAEAEDPKATISIKGNEDLQEGENTVTISVSAEDGTIKIYEIKVTRNTVGTLGLSSIKIAGKKIENFKTDTYNYDYLLKEDLSKLDIEVTANNSEATVEILGNENLQEGENTITIIVTSKDGEEKAIYQIKVNKDLTANANEKTKVKSLGWDTYIYIAVVAICTIALIIVIVYYIKHRNTSQDEETVDNMPSESPDKNEDQKNDNFEEKLSEDTKDNISKKKKGKHF